MVMLMMWVDWSYCVDDEMPRRTAMVLLRYGKYLTQKQANVVLDICYE